MKIYENPASNELAQILQRPSYDFSKIEKIVKPILEKVQRGGDKALRKLALEYDHVELDDLWVTEEEFEAASGQVQDTLKESIQIAYQNIRKFHEAQLQAPTVMEVMPGVTCSRRQVPIEKVGLYVPGGSAPLFSTVLMLAVPAQIAGCHEVIISSPTNRLGQINPVVLYTAQLVGVKRVLKLGGAQAIAAMGYGTDTVPKVDKIFGPGNQYVTVAKQMLAKQDVAIDMPAGPSEVMVVVDKNSNAAYAASDLLAQAEHGPDSQVVLVSTSKKKAEEVNAEVEAQLSKLSRKKIAEKALGESSIIVVEGRKEVLNIINSYGPEHLIISTEKAEKLAEKVISAGSVFVGEYTPESAGDYASGTNHTLPTNGWAKSYSGVSVDSFVKNITYQRITQEGLMLLGPTVERMAEAELLDGHKNAVTVRLNKIREDGISGKLSKESPEDGESILFRKG
ncbi:histidinol dehydrogenase [Marinoscillum furvescens]|uniref:histidinol dehydrogenase n=1 Tax=Marinoscillum furvescens TaxID=1026 RepID=UPI000E2265BB